MQHGQSSRILMKGLSSLSQLTWKLISLALDIMIVSKLTFRIEQQLHARGMEWVCRNGSRCSWVSSEQFREGISPRMAKGSAWTYSLQ
jgi:hypothetical protein